ncbi:MULTISPECIES: spermidine synthase [unclassified Colwellia]|jgi:spermidine synthase|uniref:spermidine synthase n=1 Tax=unclassified Colwellia TaxID=196834 RepID=UPI0015F3F60F|nr:MULTISPECIES: fused MFS/spermidine synthase [unclassified Colwellia]MBA6381142.1 fused MFS/spermidine synthase [Colwellia sp. BRX10-7]MBA6388806.1 fused MFS/spermidine synthase [Colwellia sp. BRX10-2]MBA6403610.1 fused MFS/spermidine synthase [Colwellia sp. BRX10-5]MBA6407558.1 fused MFS/spermidine synthase [Colwellia sp. BRX10-1]
MSKLNYSILTIFILSCLFVNSTSAEVVHQERSLYRNILVDDQGDLRCLKFNVKTTKTNQSCFYKTAPQRLVFNYTKLLFSGLLLIEQPKSILIVGLGGGTMSNVLQELYPTSKITNVEIDPAVVKVARQYFGFLENQAVSSVIQDGRIFIKRALIRKQQYDWIILDAFNGDYIPEHLLTQEFLQEAKDLLSPEGVLSANTFSVSDLYAHESATYKAVFGDFYNVRNYKNSNRIILAAKGQLPSVELINQRAKKLQTRLTPFNIDLLKISQQMTPISVEQDWPEKTKLLTDQFSPANLLN